MRVQTCDIARFFVLTSNASKAASRQRCVSQQSPTLHEFKNSTVVAVQPSQPAPLPLRQSALRLATASTLASNKRTANQRTRTRNEQSVAGRPRPRPRPRPRRCRMISVAGVGRRWPFWSLPRQLLQRHAMHTNQIVVAARCTLHAARRTLHGVSESYTTTATVLASRLLEFVVVVVGRSVRRAMNVRCMYNDTRTYRAVGPSGSTFVCGGTRVPGGVFAVAVASDTGAYRRDTLAGTATATATEAGRFGVSVLVERNDGESRANTLRGKS